MKALSHLHTINEHRRMVRKICFRLGLYYQGLTHDLSKYSPSEFLVGAKYYQGYRSPNNAEREEKGYSAAWLHHKGRNKHHYEYWMDYAAIEGGIIPARMPNRYLAEMYADRVAASKIYNKDKYTQDMPLKYFLRGKDAALIEKHTKVELEHLLNMLAQQGDAETEKYIRTGVLKNHAGAKIAQMLEDRKNKAASR